MKCIAALVLAIALPVQALAWGYAGHMMINRLAAQNLSASLPAFVRTPQAIDEIAQLGPEEDVLKGSGISWDSDNDPGHYLDIGDDGTVAGVVKLTDLPKNMEEYSLALEKAGTDPYKMGFVPYTIMDGYEQLRQDFAYWRLFRYLENHADDDATRARYAELRKLREDLTLRDIGVWAHFVGDGSQPLHITYHFNGWGDYPNPNNFTTKHIHSQFETAFVNTYAKIGDVRAMVKPYAMAAPTQLLSQAEIAGIVGRYLLGTNAAVVPLYRIYAAGGFDSGSQQAIDFTDVQLARGAMMLSTLISLAWDDSLNASVGYPATTVRDALNEAPVRLSD